MDGYPAWLLETVKEKSQIQQEAREQKKKDPKILSLQSGNILFPNVHLAVPGEWG